MTQLQAGDMAPDFKSTTQDGAALTLADLKGQRTILYFYPKDNTSGCTLEAKSLRDGREELARMGFRIIGVSPDSEKSHRNFCAKHDLNFTLLADTDHSVCEAYGVWAEKSMYGRKYMGVLRTTFVIDAEGRIEKVFTKVDTANHKGGRQHSGMSLRKAPHGNPRRSRGGNSRRNSQQGLRACPRQNFRPSSRPRRMPPQVRCGCFPPRSSGSGGCRKR